MNLSLIELLDYIKFVLQNEKSLVFSDNFRHYDLCEGLCVRKSDVNNHLILSEKDGSYIGSELARIKPHFPKHSRFVYLKLESRNCAVYYYGLTNKDTICIKNEINIVQSDGTIIEFGIPITRDEYFNQCLIHDIKVQYEEMMKIYEISQYLTDDRGGIII